MALNLVNLTKNANFCSLIHARAFHVTAACNKIKAGRFRKTPKGDMPLTYEMANPPHYIGVRKAWNSWDTSNLSLGVKPPGNIWNIADLVDYHTFKPHGYEGDVLEAHRAAETVIEDMFIRKFMMGTWHGLCLSEIIIKRQHNHIRIASIIRQGISARKMYFLIGYTEEFLSYWLQCPITLELQTTPDSKDVIFKYI
ncbi:small ribosomal subunit protein uS3m [Culicoides brevitarsis]|uniref:small ribosomal subunit protein uS3m n=1 Tax=Culicoides brevitarsis TaxID=469753 RepID=UPI00307CB862